MKKYLALLLSAVLLVTCFASMAFSASAADIDAAPVGTSGVSIITSADGDEASSVGPAGDEESTVAPVEDDGEVETTQMALFVGQPQTGAQYANASSGTYFGQKFTVPAGNFWVGMSFAKVFTYGDGGVNESTFKVWAWDTDYATTVAASPLYESVLTNVADNTENYAFEISADEELTGTLYYEIKYTTGTKTLVPCEGQGNAEGVVSFYKGTEDVGSGLWGANSSTGGIAATISMVADPDYVPEVTTEAATEAATVAATEAATEAATVAATEAATEVATVAATEAATEVATVAGTEAATTAAAKEEGCKSVVGSVAAIAMIAVAGAAVVVKKRD